MVGPGDHFAHPYLLVLLGLDMYPNRLGRFCLNAENAPYLPKYVIQHFPVGRKLKQRNGTAEYRKRDFANVITLKVRISQKAQTQQVWIIFQLLIQPNISFNHSSFSYQR